MNNLKNENNYNMISPNTSLFSTPKKWPRFEVKMYEEWTIQLSSLHPVCAKYCEVLRRSYKFTNSKLNS